MKIRPRHRADNLQHRTHQMKMLEKSIRYTMNSKFWWLQTSDFTAHKMNHGFHILLSTSVTENLFPVGISCLCARDKRMTNSWNPTLNPKIWTPYIPTVRTEQLECSGTRKDTWEKGKIFIRGGVHNSWKWTTSKENQCWQKWQR